MKKLPIVRWFDDLKSALSIYIAGNVAPSPNGVEAGKFYFWNGKVRFPTSNISAGETLTDSNMPAVPEGGLNKVNEKIVNFIEPSNLTKATGDFTLSRMFCEIINKKLLVASCFVTISSQISSGSQFATIDSAYKFVGSYDAVMIGEDHSCFLYMASNGNTITFNHNAPAGQYILSLIIKIKEA